MTRDDEPKRSPRTPFVDVSAAISAGRIKPQPKRRSFSAAELRQAVRVWGTLGMAGLVVWSGLTARTLDRAERADRDYLPVQATTLEARLITTTAYLGGTRVAYEPRITYRFAVAGRSYVADTLQLQGRATFRDEQAGRAYLDRHFRPGKRILAFYDPNDPRQAVVFRQPAAPGATVLALGGAWLAYVASMLGLRRLVARAAAQGARR